VKQRSFTIIGERKLASAPVSGAQLRAQKSRDLLWWFYDGLSWFRVIADHHEVTVMWGHRSRRIRRADDRERLHCECKTQQGAEGERFHIAVPLCIIRAIEIIEIPIAPPRLNGQTTGQWKKRKTNER
jgi:hypothetical protein